jgi:hypothetical protein
VRHNTSGEKFFGSFFQKRTKKGLLFYKKEAKNFFPCACGGGGVFVVTAYLGLGRSSGVIA